MHGGHECRQFFSGQFIEHNKRITAELPPQELSQEEIDAGVADISKAFGFYATMDNIARYVGADDKEVLNWSVNRFYTKVKYLAWRAHAQKRLSEILKDKKS